MQQLYLSDLGNTRTNVASDVTTPCPDVQIEANKGDSTQTLSPKKGETAEMENNMLLILLVLKEMMKMLRRLKLLRMPSNH
jgi:hypothetical protein